uniref:Solute carrier family 25 member 42 n=1 Tax=Aceria tosichella TaxID=561515 RepID=A0A6G1S7E7_9ACAR
MMITTALISGAVAGGVAKTCIAPLDRTKIHFQINDSQFSIKEAAKFLSHTYNHHGFTALWRGNSATMIRILPYAALQYCSHEQFKILLEVDTNERKKNGKAKSFLAGSLAGLVSSICTYPLDLARARMAVSQSDKVRLTEIFKTLVIKDGYLALYRGCLPSILGIIPYAGVTFFTYETAKRLHYEHTGKHEPNHLQRMAFGALAGLLGQSASYPLDVVRRRMQTSPTRLGMTETMIRILVDPSPFKSMYRGLSLNWIKGPISVGISFTTFDLLTKLLRE